MSVLNKKEISLEGEDKSLLIHLEINRQEACNSLSEELILNLKDTLTKLSSQNNIKALILSGKGKHFCAGADLK